jgi:hypothetical protein
MRRLILLLLRREGGLLILRNAVLSKPSCRNQQAN